MTIYCYWHRPRVVVAAKVSTAPTFPIQHLDLNTFTTHLATKEGQTVLVGTDVGKDDRGRTRIKYATGSASTFINTAWCSKGQHDGELNPVVGSYVTVLDEHRLWAKIPRIEDNGDVFMDGDRVGSAAQNVYPVANCGPDQAGTINAGTGLLQLTLDGSNSFQWVEVTTMGDHGITSIDAGDYTWDVGAGSVVTGSLTSATLTVRFPPGVHQVSLTVSRSAPLDYITHTAYMLVYARDPAFDQCLPHQIVSHTATPKGQEMDIRFFGYLDPDVYRDGSKILVWEEDGVNPSRMIFSGWHLKERGSFAHQRTAGLGESVLHFVDVNGRLSEMPGFSLELQKGTGVSGLWNETANNNLFYYLWFVLYWQSTVVDLADLIAPDILPWTHFVRLRSDAGNLYDQVNGLANMMTPDFYLTCNRPGQMLLVPDPSLVDIAKRSTDVTFVGDIDNLDFIDVSVETQRHPRVFELLSGAILSSDGYELDDDGNEIVATRWSLAPGKTRGQGKDSVSNTNRIVNFQTDLNTSEGNRYAHLNSPYGDIHITMPWNPTVLANADPGVMGRLVVNFSSSQPSKPFPDDAVNCLIKQIDYQYDYQRSGLVRTVQLTLEVETWGPPALTWTRPVEVPI